MRSSSSKSWRRSDAVPSRVSVAISARMPVRVTRDEHMRDPPRDGASNTIMRSLACGPRVPRWQFAVTPGTGFATIREAAQYDIMMAASALKLCRLCSLISGN